MDNTRYAKLSSSQTADVANNLPLLERPTDASKFTALKTAIIDYKASIGHISAKACNKGASSKAWQAFMTTVGKICTEKGTVQRTFFAVNSLTVFKFQQLMTPNVIKIYLNRLEKSFEDKKAAPATVVGVASQSEMGLVFTNLEDIEESEDSFDADSLELTPRASLDDAALQIESLRAAIIGDPLEESLPGASELYYRLESAPISPVVREETTTSPASVASEAPTSVRAETIGTREPSDPGVNTTSDSSSETVSPAQSTEEVSPTRAPLPPLRVGGKKPGQQKAVAAPTPTPAAEGVPFGPVLARSGDVVALARGAVAASETPDAKAAQALKALTSPLKRAFQLPSLGSSS